MDFEEAKRLRDRRLKKAILNALQMASKYSPTAELSGDFLVDQVNGRMPSMDQFEDAGHAMESIRYLVDSGYAVMRVQGLRKLEQLGLRHLMLKIAPKGTRLWNQDEPIDPMIDDDRMDV